MKMTDKDLLSSFFFFTTMSVQDPRSVSRFLAVRGTESREKQQPVSVLWNQKSFSFEISYSRSVEMAPITVVKTVIMTSRGPCNVRNQIEPRSRSGG